MTKTASTEMIRSSEIRPGDVIRTHGMRCRVETVGRFTSDNGHGPTTVYAAESVVLNVEDVRAAGIVPMDWIRAGWTIQGNDYATWMREA